MEEELNRLITGQSDAYGHCGSGRESEKDLRDLLVVHAERWREGEEVRKLGRFVFHHMSGSLHNPPPCPV